MTLVAGLAVLAVLAVILIVGAQHRADGVKVRQLCGGARRNDQQHSARSRRLLEAAPAPPAVPATAKTAVAPWAPPSPERLGVTRRTFLNRSAVTLLGVSAGALSGAFLSFLWPQATGGFGSVIHVARAQIDPGIAQGHGFFYVPEGRMWITAYPATALPKARKAYSAEVLKAMDQGYVFLYQKCPHLGCRVPSCVTSQWFECPCHGSKYNRVGEKKAGPAPRGMDHFASSLKGDSFAIDTGRVILGPPIGTNTTGQEAEGPHCIGAGKKA
jgi:cytochrome b6-f complex iron-sulfur subunit